MASGRVRDVVADLIFFLISQDGKRRDGRDELVVAKRLETGNGLRRRADRKGQCEPEVGVARRCEMQIAHAQGERSQPSGAEDVLLAKHRVEIVVMRGGAGGWKRSLLYKRVVGDI